MQLFPQLLSPCLPSPVFNAVFSLLCLMCASVAVYIFCLVLIQAVSCIIKACTVAIAHLYCVYGLGVPPFYTAIASFQAEFIVIEPYVVYKAIYNNTFLDKEFLHSQYIYTDDKGAMRLTSVSLASLQRPLYPLIILIIYLVYIFLLKLLDLYNLKSQYKAFHLFYYLIYSCYIIYLASFFYPKAQGDRQDFNQVIFAEYFYTNTFSQPIPYLYNLFLYLLVP